MCCRGTDFAPGHRSLKPQAPLETDRPLDLGLQMLDRVSSPKPQRALPACFCVVNRCAVTLFSTHAQSARSALQGAQGSQCPQSHLTWRVLEMGDCPFMVLGVTSPPESVPVSKSLSCSADLLELLAWCQHLLLAQLHTCAKWLWSCPRGLSRVGIRVAFGWLVCLSFLDAIAFFSLSQFCMGL